MLGWMLMQATCLLLAAGVAVAESVRKVDAGPLTAADFRGEVPDDAGGDANTATQLRFSCRYTYQVLGGRTTVTMASVVVDAYVLQDESWNRLPGNKSLLDHEQGHADIAWIQCLQARLAVREKMQRRRGWRAVSRSLDEAVAMLEAELSEMMQSFQREGQEADAAYDRETQHGLGPRQGEWRRVHAATIEELEAKLAKRR